MLVIELNQVALSTYTTYNIFFCSLFKYSIPICHNIFLLYLHIIGTQHTEKCI